MNTDDATKIVREELPPAAVRDAFLARSRPVMLRAGRIVIAEGGEPAHVHLIRGGRVEISLSSPLGRELTFRHLVVDQIFGETAAIDGAPRSANVIALENTLLAQMRREDFLRFLDEVPEAGRWIAQVLTARLRSLTEHLFEFAILPVAGRLQSELLRLAADATGDHAVVASMPTHAALAARIGTHREAVTRELNLLAAEGVLRQPHGSTVSSTIVNYRCHDRRMATRPDPYCSRLG